MPSLRRLPSLDCPDVSAAPHLSRHLSLPLPRLRHGLLLLPPRTCSPRCRTPPIRSPARLRSLSSCRSMPAWSPEPDAPRASRSAPRSLSRDKALSVEDSVVYKDLSESVHLQIPSSAGCMPVFESALQLPEQDGAGRFQVEKPLDTSPSGVPMSLRMLKRRVSAKPEASPPYPSCRQPMKADDCTGFFPTEFRPQDAVADSLLVANVPGSVNSAFGMLIFMMESLQQHALRFRNAVVCEADAQFQLMMQKVRHEMQETFLWLFQRVFACTPKLMLLTMMLLADFAAHSMGAHVALAVPPLGEPPTYAIEQSVPASFLSVDLRQASSTNFSQDGAFSRKIHLKEVQPSFEPCLSEGGAGGGLVRSATIGGDMDGGAISPNVTVDRAAITSQEETHTISADGASTGSHFGLGDQYTNPEESNMINSLWQQALSKEMVSDPILNQGHVIVAPVRAPALEADDYTCFDRTDLTYQHELCRDPRNPLLLANYAQFLHLVRHDHPRAEELYKRAVKADPADGELMGKYASFLWVAKEDLEAADDAYKAALAVEPANAYHAGSYANFLWNSGVDQDDMSAPNAIYQEVPAS